MTSCGSSWNRGRFGERCYAIGFGTDHGTVAAAPRWDAPMEVMQVRPSHEQSYEHLFSAVPIERFFLPLRASHAAAARSALLAERLERAIGVIYRPDTELESHYFRASLPRQFDEWIWFDESSAVEALAVRADSDKAKDTFPYGV